ncbi:hypothetical protein NQ318_016338, partial [Aromia moschata]
VHQKSYRKKLETVQSSQPYIVELKYLYTNLASLVSKFQEFMLIINNLKPTIILISETWLKPIIPDSIINIPNYTIFRKDRTLSRGGGVCIYRKEKIEVEVLEHLDSSPIESLWLNIKWSELELNIACVYRPPNLASEDDVALLNLLIDASSSLKNLIIFGDFNYPELNWDCPSPTDGNTQSANFMNTYISTNLLQLIKKPTRFRAGNNPSLLDLILVNDPGLISTIEYEAPVGNSDHIVILAITQMNYRVSQTYTQQDKRNFPFGDYAKINTYFYNMPDIPDLDLENTWRYLLEKINNCVDQNVPIAQRRNSSKPWINASIRHDINIKRKLWKKYRSSNAHTDYQIYREYSNVVTTTIRNAKKQYEHNLVNSRSNKQFFKYIKNSLDSKVSSLLLRHPDTGELVSNPEEVANLFALEFSKSFNNEPEDNMPTLPENLRNPNTINTIHINEQKVMDTIDKIKSDSSSGPD